MVTPGFVVPEELPGDELGDLLFVALDGERKSQYAADLSNGERWSVFFTLRCSCTRNQSESMVRVM